MYDVKIFLSAKHAVTQDRASRKVARYPRRAVIPFGRRGSPRQQRRREWKERQV